MTDKTAGSEPPAGNRKHGIRVASKAVSATNKVRSRLASLVWLLAVVAALFVAVGALLIALKANQQNSIVRFVLDVADRIDGPFSRRNGIFTFAGKQSMVKAALVNWGIAAVIYLVIGKILDRIIRP